MRGDSSSFRRRRASAAAVAQRRLFVLLLACSVFGGFLLLLARRSAAGVAWSVSSSDGESSEGSEEVQLSPWRRESAQAASGARRRAPVRRAATPPGDRDSSAALASLRESLLAHQRAAATLSALAERVRVLAGGEAPRASSASPQRLSQQGTPSAWSHKAAKAPPVRPPLPPLPPAPPSLYEALPPLHLHLPRPRARPDAAATPGSTRLTWPALPADVSRREAVRAATRHAWASYVRSAWGTDELQPLTGRGKNSFGGLGATVIDSLDTLLMLNLTGEYAAAREWVRTQLAARLSKSYDASVFETTIRVVGGLLSAAHLSGEGDSGMLVRQAVAVADRLMPAFESPSGIPYSTVNLASGRARNAAWAHSASPLAEFGTTQLELSALSDATGDVRYGEKSEGVIRMLMLANNRITGPASGLFPLWLNPTTNTFTSHRVSFGALGDSAYEYLLKMWLIGNQTLAVSAYRHLWEEAMESMIHTLVRRSSPGNYTYICELDRGHLVHKQDHLACFVPGMLALGAAGDTAVRYLALAQDLLETCVAMYDATPSGLAPELVNFRQGSDFVITDRSAHYLQRPEVVESLFYLWRRTGAQKWRDAGWRIFQKLQEHCRTEGGYCGVRDVRQVPVVRDDTQQSFLLAETFKYLFLLFEDSGVLDLSAWVFNTEAHPLKVVNRHSSLLEEAQDSSSTDTQ